MPSVHAFRHPSWLTNTYLVTSDQARVLIDCGGPPSAFVEQLDGSAQIDLLLLTHTHHDHVCSIEEWSTRLARVIVGSAEPITFKVPHTSVSGPQTFQIADLMVKAIPTPGHTKGHLAFLVNDALLFSGDLLFSEAVGSTVASSDASAAEVRKSVLSLMELPDSVVVYPGHAAPSTIGDEKKQNQFVRVWRHQEPESHIPCCYHGRDAAVLALGRDYDGDSKAWIRYRDGGEDIVAGSDLNFLK